jgi:hypothetical protein
MHNLERVKITHTLCDLAENIRHIETALNQLRELGRSFNDILERSGAEFQANV